MTPAARTQTAIELLDEIIAEARRGGRPADAVLAEGFRQRRYAGSGDRRAIRELVYRAIRRFGEPPASGREAFVALADETPSLAMTFDGSPYGPKPLVDDEPRAVSLPMPAWLDAALPAELGHALLDRAPLDLRVNTLKGSREEARALLPETEPIGRIGLRLARSIALEQHPAFARGLVEVQDHGSQLIIDACAVEPGMTVVDLCAGAGGKTLALAAALGNEGRLIACDTNRTRLQELPRRAERAGANVELRLLDGSREREQLRDLHGQADVVLVDAPCSGTGTLRRNPDVRWRLQQGDLSRLAALQAHVLDLAAPLVRGGGSLVYAVCSLLPTEGLAQLSAFTARQPGWRDERLPFGTEAGQGVYLTPARDGTDGFFVARLRRDH